ncbi:disease resistance protein RUN1-like [Eucalyptus grandis]|uniref:disease resistance protein RUN1-like n=1 Tax=Eucalyptus grandis TaxID=71139 RepID=UPI00192E7B2E|nr:disease resistance protein RUN1-like [Eucalyptus grandis]
MAFVDLTLERGLEIGPAINEAIEQSRSAIVVISQTYASSPWCLEELVKILECTEKKGQLVFVIFVDVDPKEMREQSGPFKRIGQSEKGFRQENADKVRRWRDALRKAGNLTGYIKPRGPPQNAGDPFGDLLGNGDSEICNDIYEVMNLMRSKLPNKRLLLVFDDVEGLSESLSHLIESMNFALGSRVILIPRHEETLIGLCRDIYEVRVLNDDQALELFSWNAFLEMYPKIDYRMLSNCFVSFSKGLPLVLTVMGSFFRGKSITEWQRAFDRLKEIPHGKVHDILRIVIDGSEANERTIFLDIACFLNGYDKKVIIKSLDQCNVYVTSGIDILAQNSLIYIDEDNKIWMHDLLQEMGRRIVIQECPENPSKRSQIWHHEDALRVVSQNSGTNAIEGIKLDKVDVEDLISNADSFKKMKKLRLFMVADLTPHCGPAGHLSEKLWECFARNNNNTLACWEALVKQVSKFWFRGA